ncbi:MAG: hypothetical protein ILP16_09735 [Spirochaetales bacterium]|nr:hypothetical protein [Spirochaetales bacterium]
MADKSLKYFMQDTAKESEIVEVPGLERFKDGDGKVIPFKIKVLTQEEITTYFNEYKKKTMVFDRKGVPYAKGNEVLYRVDEDNERAVRRIVVESLVYPDLKDKELMDFYKVVDITEMPRRVFSQPGEYAYVQRAVLSAMGLIDNITDAAKASKSSDVEEAKN